jgi:hypothetical protein
MISLPIPPIRDFLTYHPPEGRDIFSVEIGRAHV